MCELLTLKCKQPFLQVSHSNIKRHSYKSGRHLNFVKSNFFVRKIKQVVVVSFCLKRWLPSYLIFFQNSEIKAIKVQCRFEVRRSKFTRANSTHLYGRLIAFKSHQHRLNKYPPFKLLCLYQGINRISIIMCSALQNI